MRKLVAIDDDGPRRGRGAAVALEPGARSRMMQVLLHSPTDLVAGIIAATIVIAIIVNAMFMQAGRHPSPMFSASVTPSSVSPTSPLPRPRPIEALARPDIKPGEIRITEARAPEPKAADPQPNSAKGAPTARAPAPARSDPVGDLITSSRRVASVQRALTDYGYGQLKPTGTVGSDTQAAIQKFERDRKIPVTGQMSERLVRELSAMTGRPID